MTNFSANYTLKLSILSEKMATPNKPTNKGKDARALPEYTALTGNRPDGTLVPTKKRSTPSGGSKNAPYRIVEETDTTSCNVSSYNDMNDTILTNSISSFNDMNDTIGWCSKEEDWATQVEKEKAAEESSLLDETDEEQEKPQKGNGKNRKRRTKREVGPQDKRTKFSWSDAAKNYICLITSENLDLELVHEDFTHIQSQVLRKILALPVGESDDLMMPKSGIRNGGIQLALETPKGVEWYREMVPQLQPREVGGPRYRFFGPGQRPFYVYKAYSAEVEVSKNKDDVKTYSSDATRCCGRASWP